MGELYASETLLQVILVTGVIGGGAAWLTGQAIAGTWRPFWPLCLYMLLAAAVRSCIRAVRADLIACVIWVYTLYFLALGDVLRIREPPMATQYIGSMAHRT